MADKLTRTPFGKLLETKRKEAGLSYRELSNLTNGVVSYQSISHVEKGRRPPFHDVTKIQALAKALGNTTYEELMEVAGYGRKPSKAGDAELAVVLSRMGLHEAGIREVEGFVKFQLDKQAKGAKARR